MDFMDPVLATLHSDAWIYCLVRGGPDWGLRIPASPTAQFHSVLSGRCWITSKDEAPVQLRAGDFAVLPQGSEHLVLDHPDSRAVELLDAVDGRPDKNAQILELGDGDRRTELVCGGFQLTRPGPNPLRELPPLVTLRGTARGRGSVPESILDIAAEELTAPQFGSATVLSSLGRLLLVETLRAASHQLPADHAGLLAATHDERISAVLAEIHSNPGQRWTVQSFADVAGTSRSTLTARFRQLMGVSVTRYLTEWRMSVAMSQLQDTDLTLAQLASALGYGSEAAFSRAYKRHTGFAPGTHRRQMRSDDDTPGDSDVSAGLPPLFQAAISERLSAAELV